MRSFVPVTQFNKGKASQIFDRLYKENRLIVLKNNQPSAIILSPEEYERLSEIEKDYFLIVEAHSRLERNAGKSVLSETQVMKDLGITEEEIQNAEKPAPTVRRVTPCVFGVIQNSQIKIKSSLSPARGCRPPPHCPAHRASRRRTHPQRRSRPP